MWLLVQKGTLSVERLQYIHQRELIFSVIFPIKIFFASTCIKYLPLLWEAMRHHFSCTYLQFKNSGHMFVKVVPRLTPLVLGQREKIGKKTPGKWILQFQLSSSLKRLGSRYLSSEVFFFIGNYITIGFY